VLAAAAKDHCLSITNAVIAGTDHRLLSPMAAAAPVRQVITSLA